MAWPGEGEARAATSFPDRLGPPPYRAHLWSKTFFFCDRVRSRSRIRICSFRATLCRLFPLSCAIPETITTLLEIY